MSVRRQPPPNPLIPDLPSNARPTVSGEYRMIAPGRRRSSATMTAVRPEIRRASSTSLPAVRVTPAPVTGATASGAPRYRSMQMAAVRPPLSSGRELDDFDFDFDLDLDADGALELDGRPSSQGTRVETPRPETLQEAPPARRSGQLARVTPSSMISVDAHAALIAFSGFGNPPTSLLGTPAYAARVIGRRRTLRRELQLARLRASHDVGIYEASLRTADDGAVRSGVLLMAAFFTLMTLLVWTSVRVASGTLAIPW